MPVDLKVSGALTANTNAVFFDLDSPALTPDDTGVLDTLASAWLATSPPDPIVIEGFASLDGDASHNETLAQQRADAVVAYLIGKGIPKDKVSGKGKGATSHFDEKDPRQNRRATLPTPPAGPPKPPGFDFYAQGHQDGLDGKTMICPKDADEAGEKAYNQGYAAGQQDREKMSLVRRIESDLAGGFKLDKEIGDLRALDMDGILDVMEALKRDGQLENFAGIGELPPRIGTAILTIKPDLETYWQEGVAKLAPPEREAVLKRVPDGSYKGPSGGAATPPSSPPANADDGTSMTIGLLFQPTQVHREVSTGKTSSDPLTYVVQGQWVFSTTRVGKFGFQHTIVAQGGFSYDSSANKFIRQPTAGFQETMVRDLFGGMVQLQAYADLMAGATFEVGKGIPYKVVAPVVAAAQLAVGVQAVFTVPWTNKHLQLVIQSQVSGSGGNGLTVDASWAGGVQLQF